MLYVKHQIKQVYIQSNEFCKNDPTRERLLYGTYTNLMYNNASQLLPSKNFEAFYLMCFCLFLFQALAVSHMSVLPQNTRERAN